MTKLSSFVEWCLRFVVPAKFCSISSTREVTSHVPVYFQNQTVPTVSYKYANTVAPKFSIVKRHCGTLTLELLQNLNKCDCSFPGSLQLYCNPSRHVIVCYLNIINHDNLRKPIFSFLRESTLCGGSQHN